MGLPGNDSTVPGPPGADSTVPGPPGADSTVPGPRGPSGAGGSTLLETSVPANDVGVDGNTALVRISDIALRGYLKAGGVWDRVFTFHGGDTVFLADSPAIADRIPAQDPAGTFSRYIGLSGYSPVTDADITMAQRPIASVADFRGGFFGTSWASSNDTLPFQSVHPNLESAAGNLQIAAAVPFYLWFGLPLSVNGLDIVSVSYNSVGIPITKQANAARGGGEVQIWVSDATYMWAEIKDHPFVLTIEKDASAPNTYNRYAVVTANPNPTAADFLSANATFSGGGQNPNPWRRMGWRARLSTLRASGCSRCSKGGRAARRNEFTCRLYCSFNCSGNHYKRGFNANPVLRCPGV